ncbi:hypothetical protein P0Y43_16665 [Pseudomonas entomophila]|uniref:hypothetical protein n=1 Tax=Pseudomonas entomophila TaxID=312306 RepID=UPI0023D80B07|nr:hypothetical protein [Pseudomonas entomophila]MDF0732345.1 hypothetical protein [Pseudomonas entomophila]
MQNNTPKWLDLYITAFGAPGLVALAWWAGAFHAQRIRELQETYPILQITGGAGVGKSTLVANLWKLAGSSESEIRSASTCGMGALLAFMARAVNRPVVLEECDRADQFDWNLLKHCYDGKPIAYRGMGQPLGRMVFQGALAYVGGEFEVLNPRVVNIHLERQPTGEGAREAVQALYELQLKDLAQFLNTVRDNREQVIYRLGHVEAYTDDLQAESGMKRAAARNHAQLRALLNLLGDLFCIPDCPLTKAQVLVREMAFVHAPHSVDAGEPV